MAKGLIGELIGMKYPERSIRSIAEFIEALNDTTRDCLVWYRGHRRHDWQLLPNLARTPGLVEHEAVAIKRFKQNATAFLSQRPENDWEWIFLMQHYRGLTRLLDWSESPLVAL